MATPISNHIATGLEEAIFRFMPRKGNAGIEYGYCVTLIYPHPCRCLLTIS